MENLFPNLISRWTLDDIEKLLKLRDIESEEFDFKGCCAVNDLSTHICAMANTQGGFIVLGIDEKKKAQHLIGFQKNGFKVGEEDKVKNSIRNQQVLVEPIPKIETRIIYDAKQYFFVVIHVRDHKLNKPYFLKEKGTCYIRIGASTTPAPRSAVLRLFSDTDRHIQDLNNLKANISVMSEALNHSLSEFNVLRSDVTYCVPRIDLALFRASVVRCESFLRENNMLGYMTGASTANITNILHTLDTLNTYIDKFNSSSGSIFRKDLQRHVTEGHKLHDDLRKIHVFFTSLNEKIDEYLERMHANSC